MILLQIDTNLKKVLLMINYIDLIKSFTREDYLNNLINLHIFVNIFLKCHH